MKRIFILCVLVSTLWFTSKADSQSCKGWSDASSCESQSAGACAWLDGLCRCASEIELDILFGVDSSGSIGLDGWAHLKDFLANLTSTAIANEARIGFTLFATAINESRLIDFWDSAELFNYINGLTWTAGYTNTLALIESALTEFDRTYDPLRRQIFVILTDGNPCLSGECPITSRSVCEYAEQVEQSGIQTIMVGVGDELDPQFASCLLQEDSDYIPAASYSPSDLNGVLGSLSEVLCPIDTTTTTDEPNEINPQKNDAGPKSQILVFQLIFICFSCVNMLFK
eukprot:CAMPEP_0202688190 /NCGR_PEP_ID=MMETSP1385-20130828/3719_1 /ASSEMBLY_ACC=CAM_ASM_000861 /TAXON_ID=933848 /ORGANISM="Elphidium margaritaceum" /LENGTH=284 /DNA_ID=CAMNT_0049343097 /DNA_START=112 /DNA_END=966 /DNA_ORIENTATION=-